MLFAFILMVSIVGSACAAGLGDYVAFGSYEQDNDFLNGKEPIEWLMLHSDGQNVLLISRYALDCQPYHNSNDGATWADSSLRRWLNDNFFSTAFSSEEQRAIVPTSMWNNKGDRTTDSVFLMSNDEALSWFRSDVARTVAPTPYAIAQGAYSTGSRCWYWSRSSGTTINRACYINTSGLACGTDGGIDVISRSGAVRPVIWVNLDALIQQQK